MYSQIMLIGNLGSDVEMRYTPAGVPVSTFSLAVNKSWTGADGQKQSKTTWYRVTCWRKLAETVSEYIKKGSKVMVIGEDLEARAWTDRDGANRASLELTASTVRFLDSKGEGAAKTSDSYAAASAPEGGTGSEKEIPF